MTYVLLEQGPLAVTVIYENASCLDLLQIEVSEASLRQATAAGVDLSWILGTDYSS